MDREWGGRWKGFYRNPHALNESGGDEFGIEARFDQWGSALSGAMIDLEPIHTVPLRDLASKLPTGSWSSSERRNVERWLARFPGIVVRSELPENSDLVGVVSRDSVDFEKRYLGSQTTLWLDGERELGRSALAEHKVQYRGLMSADGLTIAGVWTIRAPGLSGVLGKNIGSGDFKLVRED